MRGWKLTSSDVLPSAALAALRDEIRAEADHYRQYYGDGWDAGCQSQCRTHAQQYQAWADQLDAFFAAWRALVVAWREDAEDAKQRGYLESWNERLVCANELEALLAGAAVPLKEASTQAHGWQWPEAGNAPTDKELARVLPTLPLEQRIETVIRKYVGGGISRAYDGETASNVADREIAAYLLKKLRPWLSDIGGGPPADPPGEPPDRCPQCGSETWCEHNSTIAIDSWRS